MKSPFLPLVVFLLVICGLVSCSKNSNSDQKISIYASLDEGLARQLFPAFEKETGIRVEFVRLSTGEAAARIEAEKNRPQAALWVGGVGLGHAEAKAKGLTVPYISPAAQKVPEHLRDKDHYWTGLYRGILSFVSNKSQLEARGLKAPESWKDITDPHWKGLIQLPNPGTSGTSFNLMTTLIQSMGEEKAFEYLKALHKNVAQYTKSGTAPAKNVALGESVVAVGYFHDLVRLSEETKAPLQISFPKEGTGYEIAAVSVIKDGPRPELAKKLYDWMFSPTAAQMMADYYLVPIVQDGVKVKDIAVSPKDLKLIDVDMDWAGKNKARLIDLWNTKINT